MNNNKWKEIMKNSCKGKDYKNMSNEEMILAFHDAETDKNKAYRILSEIYKRCRKMIWAIVWDIRRKCSLKNSECVDDLFQEGYLGMEESMHQFKKDKGAVFTTFSYRMIFIWIKRFCDKNCKDRDKQVSIIETDIEKDRRFREEKNPLDLLADKERLSMLINSLNQDNHLEELFNTIPIDSILSGHLDSVLTLAGLNIDKIIDSIFQDLIKKTKSFSFLDQAILRLSVLGKDVKQKNGRFSKKLKREEICRELGITRGQLDYRLDSIHKELGCSVKILSNIEGFKDKLMKQLFRNEKGG